MTSIDADLATAFGPITAMLNARKRTLRLYNENKNFRWHGERHLRDLRNIEFEIRWALFTPNHS